MPNRLSGEHPTKLLNSSCVPQAKIRRREGIRQTPQEALRTVAGVLDRAANAIAVVDRTGRLVLANRRWAEITGYTSGELAGRLYTTMVLPQDRARVQAAIARAMEGAEISGCQAHFLEKQGGKRAMRLTLGPVSLDHQNFDAVVIAEQLPAGGADAKRAEQALRESEDRYRDLVENCGVLIGTHDQEGRILSVNRAILQLAGCQSAEAMLGSKVSDFLSPEVRHLFGAYLETVLRQGRARGLMRVQTGTGEERILEYDNSLRREGLEQPIIRCIGRDVTEQKRAERALRKSEERYRLVAENSQDLIALIDPEGRMLYASPSHSSVLGYAPESLLNHTVLELVHPGDESRVQHAVRDLVHSGGRRTIEARFKKLDGDWLEFETLISAVVESSGPVTRLLLTARDITERRRIEGSLHRLSGRLMQLQDEERRRIARELHDSTAQSLAALSMNLEAANDSAAHFSPRAAQALSESLALARHCLREIRTLSYSLHPPQPDDFGLVSALQWYVAGFAKRSGVRVQLELPAELPRLPQDVELTLFRIVQESFSNIHRHSGSPTARVCVELGPHHVKLEVRDQGRGVPPSILQHVNESLADLGVGIAGMRERVRQLGGKLEIDSDNRGTTVRASLPLEGLEG